MSRSALLLGASGLVGGHCLDLLLNDQTYDTVSVFLRRELARQHPKLQQHIIDFDQLDKYAHLMRAQDIFCCLGTTIDKAGSRAAFRKVDFDYPVNIARVAAQNGAEQFLLVTALGANANAAIFYNRIKGEVEDTIRKLPFRSVHFYRPSLLLGERPEYRRREKIAENLMKALAFLMIGPAQKYRPIAARTVAAAMIAGAKMNQAGVHIHESDEIQQIGEQAEALA